MPKFYFNRTGFALLTERWSIEADTLKEAKEKLEEGDAWEDFEEHTVEDWNPGFEEEWEEERNEN